MTEQQRRRSVWGVLVLLAALGVLLVPAAASAHESLPTGVQRIELSLGERSLALTITAPPEGGGRMPVVVLARGEAVPGGVTLAAVRPGADASTGGPVPVPAAPVGQPHEVALTTDGPGAWEVTVSDGAQTARVPVTVAATTPTPGWVWAVRVGAVLGAVTLIAALAPAVRARPRLALALGGVALVAVTVAVTAAVAAPASTTGAPATATGTAPVPSGHAGHAGHGGAAMPPTPAAPATAPMSTTSSGAVVLSARTTSDARAGVPTDLVLDLTDGSSGAVVDDLTIHDEALIHLAVIGPDGQLSHLHPVRTAPGRYEVRMTAATGGRYGVFAEMERSGEGGHQVARTAFDVAGPAPAAAPAPGPGVRDVAGMRADVAVPDPVAGRPTQVSLTLDEGGAPVTNLQGWLGMAGHLMVLGPGTGGGPDPTDPASAFGHVHDMAPAGPTGTYGPRIAFDYTFPRAGRYALWLQVQRDLRIVTVPVTVDVAPESPAP
ncbi:hypothetical protein [Actinomycetospora cinnamomea]|uniref:Secreted protein n=1 Tax=Actinomycetospora cinnamomea TaxID=663609 RepID=A0A2U1FM60_9PSEU|nr:hypothetical protein [Actinomycetospora cinnamomea]PVZ13281.1 hypothetical protein C8D89_102431 [Actinomycetospora cinnamomea]